MHNWYVRTGKLALTEFFVVDLPPPTSPTAPMALVTAAIQGILLVKHQSVHAPDGMVRLWMHEMSRVFGDRLAESNHRVMFEHMLIEAVGRSAPFSYHFVFATTSGYIGAVLT